MAPDIPKPTSTDGIPSNSIGTEQLIDGSVTSSKQSLAGSVSQPSRAIGTIYQNTSGKLLIVVASIALDTVAATDTAKCTALNDTVTPPVSEDGQIESNLGAVGQTETLQIIILVPSGNYYEITSTVTGTGTATLIKWTEYTL